MLEVIGAVDDDIVRAEHFQRDVACQACFVEIDAHFGIDGLEAIASGMQFRTADVGRAVQDLALKIAEIDDIEIDDADAAHAGGGEIQAERRTEAAGADQQHAGRFQSFLAVHADFRHDEMTAVASDFVRRQGSLRARAGRVETYSWPRGSRKPFARHASTSCS